MLFAATLVDALFFERLAAVFSIEVTGLPPLALAARADAQRARRRALFALADRRCRDREHDAARRRAVRIYEDLRASRRASASCSS